MQYTFGMFEHVTGARCTPFTQGHRGAVVQKLVSLTLDLNLELFYEFRDTDLQKSCPDQQQFSPI